MTSVATTAAPDADTSQRTTRAPVAGLPRASNHPARGMQTNTTSAAHRCT